MAQQSYAFYSQQPQNRGVFTPGMKISVNDYTIQVERYLSQGGFAHVYVVRSATPINNTTQHVLKRIVVSDHAMVNEVWNEVDIMRLLRGHPNIVNIIDASCQALPNGSYEVLILMEFCSGGGLIDMMNRRLRERLTEAEILQIFVDVCEAVAAMHNLKPALLHRDLKVENILQSSLTHYKLCDFGSSMPAAPRPPSSKEEFRALDADLNRRTTLQYRAPEMVDVYLRRPIDEKSDVWALGVLLYKLCYYTTPFEEHGTLAILNVQYRFPPYPVYSVQLNALIVSMLQELGTHRPSVFELLHKVHRMRGTKSQYPYDIPLQQPLRSPLPQPPSSGLESLVGIRTSASANANALAAAQARQTVLEAIAPMRRGRPTASSISSPSLTQQENGSEHLKFEEHFNAAKVHSNQKLSDAWDIRPAKGPEKSQGHVGDRQDGFGDSFIGSSGTNRTSLLPLPSPSSAVPKVSKANLNVPRDAFEGLGSISRSREPSPTLAEAASNAKSKELARPPPLSGISRTPVPATTVPLSPWIPASRTGLATYHSPVLLAAEERFPSLDELDKSWRPPEASQAHGAQTLFKVAPDSIFVSTALTPPQTGIDGLAQTNVGRLKLSNSDAVTETSRVQPSIGADTESSHRSTSPNLALKPSADTTHVVQPFDKRQLPIGSSPTKYRPSRPALARKRRSSASVNASVQLHPPRDWLTGDETSLVDRPPSQSKGRSPAASLVPSAIASTDISGVLTNIVAKTSAATPIQQAIRSSETVISYFNAADTSEAVDSNRPRVQTRPQVREVSHRQDSSSDDPEGPEDLNRRVIHKDQKRRAKGRQSSVHDLVDLYGGAARVPADRDRARSPSPLFGRKGSRTSGLLVDLTSSPAALSAPNLLSPATIIPESAAELASRSSGSGSFRERVSPPPSPMEPRTQPSRANPSPSPPPATDRDDRPRPQSMFLLQPKPVGDSGNLRAPEGPQQRLSSRRGSISDMVDLYENLGGKTKAKDPPAIATKPVALRASKTTSPIFSRFPVISPTGASFNQVTNVLRPQSKVNSKPRNSPTKKSFDDTNLSSIVSELTKPKNQFTSRLPHRRSISPGKPTGRLITHSPTTGAGASKPARPALISIPKLANPVTSTSASRTPITETPISSPSPELPFPGVGKLIDQWQKKAEEADAFRRPAPPQSGRPWGPRVGFGKWETGQMGKGD